MSEASEPNWSRRRVLGAGAGAAVAAVLAACTRDGTNTETAAGGQADAPTTTSAASPSTTASAGQPAATALPGTTTLAPTPSCVDDDDPTPAQTEGPYFKRSSPEKTDLYADVGTGTRLTLSGAVLTTNCQPVNRALIDLWQADAAGNYDNTTFRLRGHLFTDAQGRYRVETVVPGLYPGRTRHIHVKVQAPNGPVLTTQLYFPGEARNANDGIYSKELEMEVVDGATGKTGTFNFVVRG